MYSGAYTLDTDFKLIPSLQDSNACIKNVDVQYLDRSSITKRSVVLYQTNICITNEHGDIVLDASVNKLTNSDQQYFTFAEISPNGDLAVMGLNWTSSFYIYDFKTNEIRKFQFPQNSQDFPRWVISGNVSWDRNGKVYFDVPESGIKSFTASTNEISDIVEDGYNPSVSQSGTFLSYLSKNHIYIMELESKKIVKKLELIDDKHFPHRGGYNWIGDQSILISGYDEVRLFCTGVNSECSDTFLYLYSFNDNSLSLIKRWGELYKAPFKAIKQ